MVDHEIVEEGEPAETIAPDLFDRSLDAIEPWIIYAGILGGLYLIGRVVVEVFAR